MGKNKNNNNIKNTIYDYVNTFPEWYWVHGLHDAKILNLQRTELFADFNIQAPKYNKIEILLDCDGALYETDITKIVLYNHKIISGKLPECEDENLWWIGDKLSKISDSMFKLELEFADETDKRYFTEITFQFAEVFRK